MNTELAAEKINEAAAAYVEHMKSGRAAQARGDVALALACFEAAARTKRNDVSAHQHMANALRDLGRLDEAAEAYREALALSPRHVPALTSLARIARQANDFNSASAYLRTASEAEPENVRLAMQFGEVLRRASRHAEAQSVYRAALAREPENAEALAALGFIARSLGDGDAALDFFRRALAIDAQLPNVLPAFADLLLERGQLDEAKAVYARIVARDAKNLRALRSLGRIARQSGDTAAAINHLEAARAIDLTNLGSRAELAEALRQADRLDEAAALYTQTLAEDSKHIPSLLGLAAIARTRRDSDAAYAHLKSAAACAPDDPQLRLRIAESFLATEHYDEAEAIYRAVLTALPQSAKANAGLGAIARARRDWLGALAHFQAASAAEPADTRLRIDVAKAICDLSRFDEAEQAYRTILADAPGNVDAMIGLADVARLRGDKRNALALFTQAAAAAPHDHRAKQAIRYLKTADGDFDWRTEIEEAVAAARAADAPINSQLAAAEILIWHGVTEIAGPTLARLAPRSLKARQLMLSLRQMDRMGLAQPLTAGSAYPDPGESVGSAARLP